MRASRRDGAGAGRRFAGASLWSPLQVPAAIQGTWLRELVTLTGSDVETWNEKFPSGLGNATTPGANPFWNTSDVDYKHDRSVGFDDLASEYVQIAGTATAQRFFHDGTGLALGFATKNLKDADNTQNICGSYLESGTTVGLSIRHDTTADNLLFRIGNGTTNILDVTTTNGSFPQGVRKSFVFALRNHATLDDWEIWLSGSKVLSGTLTGTPSSADAVSLMRIGARGGAISWFLNGTIGEVVAIKSFDYAERLAKYLVREHGA